jgi:5'-phosphate synthase pdxT subunit
MIEVNEPAHPDSRPPVARTIGVLAVQGDFAAHARALAEAGLAARLVRNAGELAGLAGLVLPGGESTTQLGLLLRHGLVEPLRAFVSAGAPVLATCAGLILAARAVRQPVQPSFGFLDVAVARNAWGRQLDSFEALADDGVTELVFIRAPRILELGPGVKVLASHRGEPVMVQQGNVVGATFHPELVPGAAVHRQLFAA